MEIISKKKCSVLLETSRRNFFPFPKRTVSQNSFRILRRGRKKKSSFACRTTRSLKELSCYLRRVQNERRNFAKKKKQTICSTHHKMVASFVVGHALLRGLGGAVGECGGGLVWTLLRSTPEYADIGGKQMGE